MKKILTLTALLCSLVAPATSAFAYCVYNQTVYPIIWVEDQGIGRWGGPMGPHSVPLGGRVCCAASARGCSYKYPYIDADTNKHFNSPSVAHYVRCWVKDKHAGVYIGGGGSSPMTCTIS